MASPHPERKDVLPTISQVVIGAGCASAFFWGFLTSGAYFSPYGYCQVCDTYATWLHYLLVYSSLTVVSAAVAVLGYLPAKGRALPAFFLTDLTIGIGVEVCVFGGLLTLAQFVPGSGPTSPFDFTPLYAAGVGLVVVAVGSLRKSGKLVKH